MKNEDLTPIALAIGACLLLSSCSSTQPEKKGAASTQKASLWDSAQYMVEGPWGIGDPVHEVLTLLSVRSAIEKHRSTGNLLADVSLEALPDWDSTTAHAMNVRTADRSLHQFLRGVFWPDDPEGLFFRNKRDASSFTSGLRWRRAFKADPSNPRNLTARSHFGDLQYFHAMSPLTSLSAEDVQALVLKWAGFLIGVSAGEIEPDESLNAIPSVSGLFPGRSTVRDLFVASASAPDTHIRQRAAGVLLHLLQDSYAHGHTRRSDDGSIDSFHCYNDPDHDRKTHALHDKWADGATLRARVRNTPGAATAVERGGRLLSLVNRETPRAEILGFLKAEVFHLMSR